MLNQKGWKSSSQYNQPVQPVITAAFLSTSDLSVDQQQVTLILQAAEVHEEHGEQEEVILDVMDEWTRGGGRGPAAGCWVMVLSLTDLVGLVTAPIERHGRNFRRGLEGSRMIKVKNFTPKRSLTEHKIFHPQPGWL